MNTDNTKRDVIVRSRKWIEEHKLLTVVFSVLVIGVLGKISPSDSSSTPVVSQQAQQTAPTVAAPTPPPAPVDPAILEADKKRLAELKTKFDYTYDKFQKVGWYMAKSQSVKNNYDKKLLRVFVNNSGYAYLQSQYFGDDWLFHTSVQAKIGDTVYKTDDVPTYDKDNEQTSGSGDVWENISFTNGRDNGMIKGIAESGDTPVDVRFVGRSDISDITLTKSNQQAVKDAYELSELIKKIGDSN